MPNGYTFILLGNVGAGKSTQAKLLSEQFDIEPLSTGEILRDEIARKTPLGVRIQAANEAGEFASDEIVLDIVRKRIADSECDSFLLDGVPRTTTQALRLAEMASSGLIPELLFLHNYFHCEV
jgi:adenylate kinase